jgi:hypothetical protein
MSNKFYGLVAGGLVVFVLGIAFLGCGQSGGGSSGGGGAVISGNVSMVFASGTALTTIRQLI